ncbi:MAG TPA: di-heme oxidoredictase family protein [Bryobacteraceae bacterium]|nr:di-heme oxidoredictase family protein [Bryobacteraceae bacterium]
MRIVNGSKLMRACCLPVCLSIAALGCRAQTDPGPRGGPAGAGGTFPVLDNTSATLNANDLAFFSAALLRFQEVDSVSGTIEPGSGLGPTFNGNSCALCHLQPAIGGSSPGLASPQNPMPNPQVALATLDGAKNTLPSFITANGPVREARFIYLNPSNPSGGLDGGVHDLYTIAGRSDAPGCTLPQNNFATALSQNNVIFRIPTALFGLGLVEDTPDAALEANLAGTSSQRAALSIGGIFNTSANDGTITRFGWKAQNKSLLIFAGEAYNVEQGVSNENFPNERFPAGTSASVIAGCTFNATPEDSTNITLAGSTTGTASEMSSDVINFAATARMLAPPAPTTASSFELAGQTLFSQIGCNLCHSISLTTGKPVFPALSGMQYHPYSDFALHHMGSTLADGIYQGAAGPDQFRTAPLWGVGQRLYFLHDGRTSDLLQAIEDHFSQGYNCVGNSSIPANNGGGGSGTCASEANQVINNFNRLNSSQKQDVLDFLRSL